MRNALRTSVVVALVALAGPTASAEMRVESGWWTVSPVLVAADVPDDGLLIQGSVNRAPVAFAAVGFTLEPDTRAKTLMVDVAPNSLSTPNAAIVACPLTTSFTPAHGGPAAEAPEFDCSTNVEGHASADGTSYSFDLSGFGGGGMVSTAILPTTPATRVVLLAPDGSSLDTSSATTVASPASPSVPEVGGEVTSAVVETPPALPGVPSLPQISAGGSQPSTGATPVESAAPPAPAAYIPTAPLPVPTSLPAPTAWAVLLVLAGVIVGGAIWTRVGHAAVRTVRQAESDDPRPSYS